MECSFCDGTGFYGDNGPGIIGNNEWHACDECGVVDDTYVQLAEAMHQANQCHGYLEDIWNILGLKDEHLEYFGMVPRNVEAELKELRDKLEKSRGSFRQANKENRANLELLQNMNDSLRTELKEKDKVIEQLAKWLRDGHEAYTVDVEQWVEWAEKERG